VSRFAPNIENALAYEEISQLKDKLAQEKLYLEEQISSEMNFDQIVGTSPALKQVLKLVKMAAPSDFKVVGNAVGTAGF
jgi:formate hydrogenlyase transcriptional activator